MLGTFYKLLHSFRNCMALTLFLVLTLAPTLTLTLASTNPNSSLKRIPNPTCTSLMRDVMVQIYKIRPISIYALVLCPNFLQLLRSTFVRVGRRTLTSCCATWWTACRRAACSSALPSWTPTPRPPPSSTRSLEDTTAARVRPPSVFSPFSLSGWVVCR